MRAQSTYKTFAIVLLLIAVTSGSSAQNNQPPKVGSSDTVMTMELVKTGLYMISSGGNNSLLRLSANGLILVDGNLPGSYDDMLAHVRKISKQPVRVLIVTDPLEDQADNTGKFLEGGTPIIAQENAKPALAPNNSVDDKSTPAIITYAREYRIRLGGVEAQLMHFGNARTNGDTVVYFPNLKVVAVGDLYAKMPNPDFSRGGSLVDWGPVLAQVLKLDFDVAVPGMGRPVSRADLEAFKTNLDTLVSRATGLVKNGVSKDQLMGQLKADDLGWQLSFTPEQIDHIYSELSQTEHGNQ